MVSERVVSENILKLRELTNKICSTHEIDYFDIVNEIKELVSTAALTMSLEKNKDKKLRYYELMVSKIDTMVNQKND
jgi:hypothetical protein